MQKSESISKLAAALVKFQSEMNKVGKDTKAYNYNYADMAAVWDVTRDPLNSAGLAVTQMGRIADPLYHTDDTGKQKMQLGIIVETVLVHTSGEWMSGETFYPIAKNDPQGVGSALTYGRRYGYMAILGVVTDDDDAAKASQDRRPAPESEAETPAKANKPAPAKTEAPKPAVDYLGNGPAKKKEAKLKELCTALNKAGDTYEMDGEAHKWNSEVLNAYATDNFDTALAKLDAKEIAVLLSDLDDRLQERLAISDGGNDGKGEAPASNGSTETKATADQVKALRKLCDIKDKEEADIAIEVSDGASDNFEAFTNDEAQAAIKMLTKM